jgi:hypothetical protein
MSNSLADLELPVLGAWAVPGSILLATLAAASAPRTTAGLPGPGTRFSVHAVAAPGTGTHGAAWPPELAHEDRRQARISPRAGNPTVSAGTAAPASVPVFDSEGVRVGSTVTNPVTGTVELVGPDGSILGIIVPRDDTADLIGAGGAVVGTFALCPDTGRVIVGAMPTAVPVRDGAGTALGIAVTNPATGTVELIAPEGGVLGVIEPRDGTVTLIGAGGTVIGRFTAGQAAGTVTLSGL